MYNDIIQAIILSSAGIAGLLQYMVGLLSTRPKQQPSTLEKSKKVIYDIKLFYDSSSTELLNAQLRQIEQLAYDTKMRITIFRSKSTPPPQINLEQFRKKGRISIKNRLLNTTTNKTVTPNQPKNTTEIIIAPWAQISNKSLKNILNDFNSVNVPFEIKEHYAHKNTSKNSLSAIIEVFNSIDHEYRLRLYRLLRVTPISKQPDLVLRGTCTGLNKYYESRILYLYTNVRVKIDTFSRQLYSDSVAKVHKPSGLAAGPLQFRKTLSLFAINVLFRANVIIILSGLIFTLFNPGTLIFTYLWAWYSFFYGLYIVSNNKYSQRLKLKLLIYVPVAYILSCLPRR